MKTLKIESLSREWTDRDNILLHASFQILKDCVEKEKLFTDSVSYPKSRNGKIAKELYDWWEIRRRNPNGNIDRKEYELDTKQLIRLMKIRNGLWT